MRTTSPSSTAGRSTSCWDLEKRCTSSMKSMVPWPCSPRRCSAPASASRTSFTPAAVADRVTRCLAVLSASRRARVVLPVPAGPHRMEEPTRSDSASARNGAPGPTRCSWPTTSSRVRGRRRAARGALALEPAVGGVVEEAHDVAAGQLSDGLRRCRSGVPGAAGGTTTRMPSSARLAGGQRGRGAGQRVGPGLGLGVGDDLADVLLAGQHGDQAVHARRRSRRAAGRRSGRRRAGTRSGPRPPPR